MPTTIENENESEVTPKQGKPTAPKISIEINPGDESGLAWFVYPGPLIWQKLAPGLYAPNDPAFSDFVPAKNPTDREQRALINLGVDMVLQCNLERLVREPNDRLSEAEMRASLSSGKPLRSAYVRTLLVWEPGQVIDVPREWWPALRTVDKRTGVVIGGLAPHLVLDGEVKPPELHPTIAEANESVDARAGRRRK